MEDWKSNLTTMGFTVERIPAMGYRIGMKDCDQAAMIRDEMILLSSGDTKTIIHHTPECLEGQKAFLEFQEFIEGFGGYVPTPGCDCPREKVPKEKHETLGGLTNMIFRRLKERCEEVE